MSMEQSDLHEFDRSAPRNPANSGRGTPKSERAGRPECGYEDTKRGRPCGLPVAPGFERCPKHLDADPPEQDHSHQLAIAGASKADVSAERTRCPECNALVASMYLVDGSFVQCPECGHREA